MYLTGFVRDGASVPPDLEDWDVIYPYGCHVILGHVVNGILHPNTALALTDDERTILVIEAGLRD